MSDCTLFCRIHVTLIYSNLYQYIIGPYLSMQTGEAPVCDPRTYHECALVSLRKYLKDNEASKCNCARQCRRLIYQTTISQSKLATSAASFLKRALNLDATVDDIINDYCLVEVCKSYIRK